MMNKSEINNFWNWFDENKNDLQSQKHPNDKLEELDRKVTEYKLRWEVGTGKVKANALTISPGGDHEKIELAKEFIKSSPTLDSWEFYSFKMPKENWKQLEIPRYDINITAEDWTYTLLKYEDGKTEVLIKGNSLNLIDPDYKVGLVEIVLINLIGEERMMTEIDFIDVLDIDDDTYELNDIEELEGHLDYGTQLK
jgi:hypothetical protein